MQSPQSLSCVPCAKRKVRCDRSKPCSHCRRRKGDVCEYPLPIQTSLNNSRRTTFDQMQSERIERLEQYIRSLGGNPEQITHNSASNPSTLTPSPVPEKLPGKDNSVPSPSMKRKRDGSPSTATMGSRSSSQAKLVEHDEQTTYIETFASLSPVFLKRETADLNSNTDRYGTSGAKPTDQLSTRSSLHWNETVRGFATR